MKEHQELHSRLSTLIDDIALIEALAELSETFEPAAAAQLASDMAQMREMAGRWYHLPPAPRPSRSSRRSARPPQRAPA